MLSLARSPSSSSIEDEGEIPRAVDGDSVSSQETSGSTVKRKGQFSSPLRELISTCNSHIRSHLELDFACVVIVSIAMPGGWLL